MSDRRLHLAIAEELRKDRRSFALPDDSGHVAFIMPPVDYVWFTNKYPELAASDPQIARRAWLKFLNTDEGAKYKVNRSEGKRAPVDRIIVR